MDERRKQAYRSLLYWATLDIRPLYWLALRSLSPVHWRRQLSRIRRAGALADWMHNLAMFSAQDFAGFDEERFWQDLLWYEQRHPEWGLTQYRHRFDQWLTEE
jgi:hypothetical protein